jgi:peptidoglycan/LPS O-acetylase OafA/YrhL
MERRVEAAPSGGTAEPYLDGLRALAVLGVVAFHAAELAGGYPARLFLGPASIFIAGSWGVELFFVLSGFLLARGWFVAESNGSRTPSIRGFYRRRIRRIVPAYYVSIVVVLAVFVPFGLVSTASVSGRLGVENLAAHLAFVQHMLPLTSNDFAGVDGVYWTLTMEMTFYAVLPFAVRLFTGRRWIVTLVASGLLSEAWIYLCRHSFGGLVAVMVRSVSGPTAQTMGLQVSSASMRALLLVQFPTWLFTFACGICLARLVVRRGLRPADIPAATASSRHAAPWWERPSTGAIAAVAGIVGIVAMAVRVTPELRDSALGERWLLYGLPVVSGVVALFVYGVSFGPAWPRSLLSALPLRYLGWVSYGVYLYHYPVLLYLDYTPLAGEPNPLLRFLLGLPIALGVAVLLATVSWLLIERPVIVGSRGAQRRERGSRRATLLPIAAGVIGLTVLAGGIGWHSWAADTIQQPSPKPPLGRVRQAIVTPSATGPTTLAQANAAGRLFPAEAIALRACGATAGQLEGLSAQAWGLGGSLFACPTPAGARSAVTEIATADRAGYQVMASPDPDVLTFRDTTTVVPGFPVVDHLLYASGPYVVIAAITARSESAGAAALRSVIGAATDEYPASPLARS